jgi:hypothetical protein
MRYFILTYYRKADGRLDEAMQVSKRLKTRDLQTANVILDFKTLQVEKCHMGGVQVPKDFHRIVEYYMQHYESIIKRLFDENGYEIVKNEETKSESEVQPNANNPS